MPTPESRNRAIQPLRSGRNLLVKAASGALPKLGLAWDNPFSTIAAAIADAQAGDTIFIEAGTYAEEVTVPRLKTGLLIVGVGGPGSVSVEATTTNGTAIAVHGRDVRLENIGGAGKGTGAGIRVTGRRFSADSRCKFENQDGTGAAIVLGPGLVANIYNATTNPTGTEDKGDFSLWEGTEFSYAAKGVILQGSDYGASGQHTFKACRSKGITAAHFAEAHLAGGAATLHYRDLLIDGHNFDFGSNDAGASIVPTKFLDLGLNAANLGKVTACSFPVANAASALGVSAGLLCVGNKHPAGLSAGQPA